MPTPIVFYVKCRPQDADAWSIARDYKIVFLGYPPWRDYESFKNARAGFRQALYSIVDDPRCGARLTGAFVTRGYRNAVAHNATLAASVCPGSFVIVPRPAQGVCYVGAVRDALHIVDEPSWADAYLRLRITQHLLAEPAGDHVADVVQCWTVNEWTEHSFGLMPRWILYRLLSRNTAGVIYDLPEIGLSAHSRVTALRRLAPSAAASHVDAMSIAGRLVEFVGPSAFEHLTVHLLQLEEDTNRRWHHIGGSGDGGVDGIAVSHEGEVVGILQCKWHHGGDVARLVTEALRVRERWPYSRVVIAILLGAARKPTTLPLGVEVLLSEDIAALVQKHSQRLPLARTLGLAQ